MTNLSDPISRPNGPGQPFEALFMSAPVGLMSLDLAGAAARLESVPEEERKDLAGYVARHPSFLPLALGTAHVRCANHFAARLLEAPSPDAMCGPLSRLLRPGSRAAAVTCLSGLATEHGYFEAQVRLESLEGRVFSALIAFSIPADGESLRSVALSVCDLSERAQFEEQIRIAQRMEAVGRLAGGIAHDFNNLLTIISNYASFLDGDLKDRDDLRADVLVIRDAAHRASRLTRQLLAFSSLQVAEPRLVNVSEILAGLKGLIRAMLSEQVDLSFSLEEVPGLIEVDPKHIEQIVVSLASNAQDAMPRGGRLELMTRNVELNSSTSAFAASSPPAVGSYVLLTVSDSGQGMDVETQARAFEPFFTTKPQGTGTGLGLSSVYGMVRQARGFIRVESAPGKGTVVELYFPKKGDAPAVTVHPRVAETSAVEGATILLVEDDVPVRNAVRRVLQGAGYEVLSAEDCQHALALCRDHAGSISAVLTDVLMPEMNGRELVEQALQVCPDLRVLYMSGYAKKVITAEAALAKGAAFIAKPFTPAELLTKLDRVLRGR